MEELSKLVDVCSCSGCSVNTLNLLNITGVLGFVESICALSLVSLYLARCMLLYDVSQPDMSNLVSDCWFYCLGVVCSECACSSNVSDYLFPLGVSTKT